MKHFSRARIYITVLLAVLLALCAGFGLKYALSPSALADDVTDVEEGEEEAGEEEDLGELSVRISGWTCGSYNPINNAIIVSLSNAGIDYTRVTYSFYYDRYGGDEMNTPVNNLGNIKTAETGIFTDPEMIKRFNRLGVGTYWLKATYDGTDKTDIATFKIANGWKTEPKVIEWTYGEYNAEINKITAEALDGGVSFTVSDGSAEVEGLVGFNSAESVAGQLAALNAGTYYLQCSSIGFSENYEFTVHQLQNRWLVIPSLNGWSEGEFKLNENKIKGEAEQGEVKFTIKDSKGRTLYTYKGGKLYNADGNSVNMEHWFNKLSAGTYTLVAEIEGTVNYSALKDEIQFSVFENAKVHGGIIAATVVFAVIDLIAAGVCIFFIIRRRKKIEDQFNKMVSKELHRR